MLGQAPSNGQILPNGVEVVVTRLMTKPSGRRSSNSRRRGGLRLSARRLKTKRSAERALSGSTRVRVRANRWCKVQRPQKVGLWTRRRATTKPKRSRWNFRDSSTSGVRSSSLANEASTRPTQTHHVPSWTDAIDRSPRGARVLGRRAHQSDSRARRRVRDSTRLLCSPTVAT